MKARELVNRCNQDGGMCPLVTMGVLHAGKITMLQPLDKSLWACCMSSGSVRSIASGFHQCCRRHQCT